MSIYAQAEKNQAQISSNLGWSQFGAWADKLSIEKYPAVVALWEHGAWEDTAALVEQLTAARKNEAPIPDVAGIIDELIEFVRGEEFVLITDGTGAE